MRERRNERISAQGYPVWDEDCTRCGGTGGLPPIRVGRPPRKCMICDGTGVVTKSDHPDTLT